MVVFLDHRGGRPHVDVILTSVKCGPGQWENRKCASEQGSKTSMQNSKLGKTTYCELFDVVWGSQINKFHWMINPLRGNFAYVALGTSKIWTHTFKIIY